MKKRQFLFLLFLFFLICSSSLFGLTIGGSVRNDFFALDLTGEYNFGDILTTGVTIEHKSDSWKSYSSLEFLYENSKRTDYTNSTKFVIKSSYLRYYGKAGHISLGKSYINFGSREIFNPFELKKKLEISELDYEKEGVMTGSFYIHFASLGSIKGFISPEDKKLRTGISFNSSQKKFNVGIIFMHNEINNNKTGFFIKGDFLVNITLSAAFHFDDEFSNDFIEATSKIDYSFNNFYIGATWYYNQKGATSSTEYLTINIPDVYLLARNYLFLQLSLKQSDFLSFTLYHFQNLNDNSGVVTGEVNYLITSGLKTALQISTATGKNETEFSSENIGALSMLFRVEGKF